VSGVASALGLVLAGVLAWAGVAKLRRPSATAASFAGLGLPLPGVLARAVPVVELATAAALVGTPALGGGAALLLLAAFTGLLALRLRGGGTVDCGCFGSARRDPLTSAALLRNGLLAAAAAAVIVVGPPAGVPPLEAAIVAGTAAAIGALGVALWDLRARTGRLWDNRLETGAGA
jgi:hypothetical protein